MVPKLDKVKFPPPPEINSIKKKLERENNEHVCIKKFYKYMETKWKEHLLKILAVEMYSRHCDQKPIPMSQNY